MPTGINRVFKLDRKTWKKVNAAAITIIKVRTAKGIDRTGRRFPPYSPKYVKLKGRGHTRLSDGKKYKSMSGKSTSRKTNPPNFRLTGETLNSLRELGVTRKRGIIGWQGETAVRVSAHEERGKYRIGGVSEKDMKILTGIVADEIDKRWNRIVKNSKVTVRL